MYYPLLVVEIVLNHQQDAAALQDLIPVVADFLGPGRNLSLHDACHIGSLQLLDWIWRVSRFGISLRAANNWSVTSYLQSNRHYYQWQFSESLEIAAGRGDLTVVKWLFEHFKDCEVAVEVVEAAAVNGHLHVLQFLLDHDLEQQERVKTGGEVAGDGYIPSGRVSATGRTVHWGGRSLVGAVENGHSEIVRWLYRYAIHGCGEAQITNAIKTALRMGDVKLAALLLPQGKCTLDYAEFCSHPDVIEWKLDCGYFRRDAFSAGVAIKYLVRSGRLDLMKRIAAQHEPPPEDSDWPTDWRCAMVHACVYGNRDILQWLMVHPAGRWTLDGDDRLFSELVFSAAYKGNIEVMAYLFERGATDKVRDALLHAIREDHLDMVKWLIEHFPESERVPDYCVMDEAARYGHLEMLQYFQRQEVSVVPGYFPVTSPTQRRARNSSGDQMFVPASDDYLKVLPTLCRYRSEWHPTEPMDDAAANGHLQVVKWLHLNRSEGCTTAAMDSSAANGHLEVVRWLHTHRLEGCTSKAVDGAAANGHLDVIRWLYANRFEGCSQKAIEGALGNGYLRVASWLHVHLPSLTPVNVELRRRPTDLFELLLFQSFHFSSNFNLGLVEHAKEILLDVSSKSNYKHIAAWLQEKFPAAHGTREGEEW